MMSRLFCLIMVLATWAQAEELLPAAPKSVVEMYGTFNGERFWARLNLPEARFGKHRMLELLYTQPTPAALGGAHLVDCPFLLLDDQLRLVAWNGRDSIAKVTVTPKGYQVTREIEQDVDKGKDVAPDSDEREVAMARGWDERLAPLMLAFAWQAKGRGEVPVADLFGPVGAASTASWQDGQVLIAGRPYRATADAGGRLARLDDAAGTAVLTIAAWISP